MSEFGSKIVKAVEAVQKLEAENAALKDTIDQCLTTIKANFSSHPLEALEWVEKKLKEVKDD